jgi:hypothetical protein
MSRPLVRRTVPGILARSRAGSRGRGLSSAALLLADLVARECASADEVANRPRRDAEVLRCLVSRVTPVLYLRVERLHPSVHDLLDERFERGRVDLEREGCLSESPASVTRRMSLRASRSRSALPASWRVHGLALALTQARFSTLSRRFRCPTHTRGYIGTREPPLIGLFSGSRKEHGGTRGSPVLLGEGPGEPN